MTIAAWFEKYLEELADNGQIEFFTPEQNLAIAKEFSEGMEEFCEAEKQRQFATLLEARHIRIC